MSKNNYTSGAEDAYIDLIATLEILKEDKVISNNNEDYINGCLEQLDEIINLIKQLRRDLI